MPRLRYWQARGRSGNEPKQLLTPSYLLAGSLHGLREPRSRDPRHMVERSGQTWTRTDVEMPTVRAATALVASAVQQLGTD